MLHVESFLDGFMSAVILMASLHGLLLALILFFNKRLRSRSNRYLAFAIFSASVVLCLEIVYYFDIEHRLPEVIQYAPIYWRTAVPVGIFYFVSFLIDPKHSLNRVEKLGFVFIGLEIFTELLYIPVNLFLDDAGIAIGEEILVSIEQLIGLVACFWFFWLALKKVKSYQKYLYDHYSTTTGKSLAWLQSFLWMNLLISSIWLTSYLLYFLGFYEASEFAYFLVTMGLAIFSFFIGYFLILQYNWFQVVPVEPETEYELQKNKLSTKTDAYYQNLMTLMEDEKLYTDVELTLQNLSERLGISPGYLSRIINEKEHKNFFEFVNAYRIQEVKEKLVDEEYGHYSILGIALESGFKSKSTFNTVFKKLTGQTPSAYQKQFTT